MFVFTDPHCTRSIFKQGLTGFDLEFSGCYTKVKESWLSYNLSLAGGRILGFISFPRVFVLYIYIYIYVCVCVCKSRVFPVVSLNLYTVNHKRSFV